MTGIKLPPTWQLIWKENRWYFITFLAFLFMGFGIYLAIAQGDDILFVNRRRTEFGDYFFRYGTQMGEEIAYIFVGLMLVFYSYRHAIMIPIIGLMVTVLSAALKEFFKHPRPFKWFQENGLDGLLQTIEGVSINMGFNSFPSGHTLSAFTLFTFLALCLPRKRINSIILLPIPLMVAISRIYLIKHFLKDVLLGALLGVALAVLLYYLQYRVFSYPHPWLDKSLSLTDGSKVKQALEEVEPENHRNDS